MKGRAQLHVTPGLAALHYFRLRFEVAPCACVFIIEFKIDLGRHTAQTHNDRQDIARQVSGCFPVGRE
jgi:hypothetical protein